MLTKTQLDQIKNLLINDYKPEMLFLFGSYALGNPTEESDLDILIVKETDLPNHKRNLFVRKLLRSFRIPKDIIVKTPQEFETYKDIIGTIVYDAVKSGKLLYEKT